jgi:hypothetical protein
VQLPHQALDMILPACDTEVWQDVLPPPRDLLLNMVRDLDSLLSLFTDKILGLILVLLCQIEFFRLCWGHDQETTLAPSTQHSDARTG